MPADTDPATTLYRLQARPFCERVVRVLEALDLDHRSRFVEPMHSDRDVVTRLTDRHTVPALVEESTDVTTSGRATVDQRSGYGPGSTAGEAATAGDDGPASDQAAAAIADCRP